jgi:hypothetical protein
MSLPTGAVIIPRYNERKPIRIVDAELEYDPPEFRRRLKPVPTTRATWSSARAAAYASSTPL